MCARSRVSRRTRTCTHMHFMCTGVHTRVHMRAAHAHAHARADSCVQVRVHMARTCSHTCVCVSMYADTCSTAGWCEPGPQQDPACPGWLKSAACSSPRTWKQSCVLWAPGSAFAASDSGALRAEADHFPPLLIGNASWMVLFASLKNIYFGGRERERERERMRAPMSRGGAEREGTQSKIQSRAESEAGSRL